MPNLSFYACERVRYILQALLLAGFVYSEAFGPVEVPALGPDGDRRVLERRRPRLLPPAPLVRLILIDDGFLHFIPGLQQSKESNADKICTNACIQGAIFL